MKRLLLLLIVIFLPINTLALTIYDVIRLSQSRLGDQVIISLINNSSLNAAPSVQDIIKMKNAGVSNKVIAAFIQRAATQGKKVQKKQERSPFDQFFLSTYYSHQYGWPRRNYDSPADILRQGLFYRPPDDYPNASRVRMRGWYYSINKRWPWGYSISPYSIIVKRKGHRRLRRERLPKARVLRPLDKPIPKLRK